MIRPSSCTGFVLLSLLLACGSGSGSGPEAPKPQPGVPTAKPAARRDVDAVGTKIVAQTDDYFGVKVADPYRWLEDGTSPEVAAWTAKENARTEDYVSKLTALAPLRERIEKALSLGYASAPVARKGAKGRLYFHTKREGMKNQPTLYVRSGDKGEDRVLLDASTLSADGTSALDWWFPSPSGKLLAWGRSEAGSEDSVLHVRDVATGKDDAVDEIPWTRHASVAFTPDEKGFFYTRYPEPGSVPAGDEKYGSKVFFHERGKPWKADQKVFGDQLDKTDVPAVDLSPDGRFVLVRVHKGWDKSDLYLWDKKKSPTPAFVALTGTVPGRSLYDASFEAGLLYIRTNDGAPNFRLYAVKPELAEKHSAWTEVLPEAKDALSDYAITTQGIVGGYLHDASTQIRLFDKTGKPRGDLALPQVGTAHVSSSPDGIDVFTSFASFAVPIEAHRIAWNGKEAKLVPWSKAGGVAPTDIVVESRFTTSKDGTRIPYFVVSKGPVAAHKKPVPTVVYGYGGFNIVLSPSFSARALAVAESGAVWVTAVLRGGGEFGEAWHRAGMLDKKQNVFDDFYAVAKALTGADGITDAAHLSAMGGSNGGLLVAASVVQHPEAFRAAASLVPLTDMLRYQNFRIAKLWIPEYGASTDHAQFDTLRAYSPLHNVKPGVRYPATMFTTAEEDSRVDPMHARKMAATLRAAQSDATRPILLRVESKAGHGAGKPTAKVAAELATELGFLLHETGGL